MIRRTLHAGIVAGLVVAGLVQPHAGAEQRTAIVRATKSAPAALYRPLPRIPQTMIADQADVWMRQLQARRSAPVLLRPKPLLRVPVEGQGPAQRPRQIVEVPAAPVVNTGPFFLFEDATGRRSARPQLTIEQRKSLVELYRQTLGDRPEAPDGRGVAKRREFDRIKQPNKKQER